MNPWQIGLKQSCGHIKKGQLNIAFLFVLTALLFFSGMRFGWSQNNISGTVRDQNGISLPFVNIVVKSSVPYGTASNIEGKYKLAIRENEPAGSEITFTCIGYMPRTISLENLKMNPDQVLEEKAESLSEVVVKANEDPAYAMIERAVENRIFNNPESLESFSFESYNKANIDVQRTDSVQKDLQNTGFEKAHFFMFESRTLVNYQKPGKWSEEIIGTRMSGIKDPSFGLVSNSFQPFSLYEDYVNVMEFKYLNPISPNSRSRYYFTLEDSLQKADRKVYLISFSPRKNSAENLLTGRLALSSDDYSIVEARYKNAGDYALMYFDIRQNYNLVDTLWFPSESNTLYNIKDSGNDMNPNISTSTYIDKVNLNEVAANRNFGLAEVSLQEGAGRQPESTWNSYRTEPLDSLEMSTYAVYDTLPKAALNAMNWMMNNTASLSRGRMGVGKVDILLNRLLGYNEYEGFRLGAGLATNEKLIKWMSVEGYYAYGFRDKDIKYGGGLRFYLNPKREFEAFVSYTNDVIEPGRTSFSKSAGYLRAGNVIRDLFARRMDWIEKYQFDLTYRPARGVRVNAFISTEQRTAFEKNAFDYPLTKAMYTASIYGAEISISPNEKLMQIGRSLVPINISYPNIKLRFSRAVPGLLEGNQNFTDLQVQFEHQFRIRGLGETRVFGAAGKIWGNKVPESYLSYGRGSKGQSDVGILSTGYFQSMPLYRFVNDEFVQMGFIHNFGSVFGIHKSFSKPDLKLAYQAAVGNLNQQNRDALRIPTTLMDHPYLEAGLIIDNILRLKSNLYYSGFGVGAFYNHGYYALPDEMDNFHFIISFAISL